MSTQSTYADDTTLMAQSQVEQKNLLMRVKEESDKSCLQQHSKTLKSPQMETSAMKLKDACSLEEKL